MAMVRKAGQLPHSMRRVPDDRCPARCRFVSAAARNLAEGADEVREILRGPMARWRIAVAVL